MSESRPNWPCTVSHVDALHPKSFVTGQQLALPELLRPQTVSGTPDQLLSRKYYG